MRLHVDSVRASIRDFIGNPPFNPVFLFLTLACSQPVNVILLSCRTFLFVSE